MPAVGNLFIDLGGPEIALRSTCAGQDLSPQMRIKGLSAISVAVLAFNPFEKGCCSFSAWLIWNLPADGAIPEGIPKKAVTETPLHAVQGHNDYGGIGYRGPCPQPGETVRYLFRVYGLDTMLDIPPGAVKGELVNALKGHVLQFGDTAASFTMPV
jgi:Raf kinase inhibitor-like YbhB/YbcL family protein